MRHYLPPKLRELLPQCLKPGSVTIRYGRCIDWIKPVELLDCEVIEVTEDEEEMNVTLRYREARQLPSIYAVPCSCACGWQGVVLECEPDVDGDGSLGCPICGAIVEVAG